MSASDTAKSPLTSKVCGVVSIGRDTISAGISAAATCNVQPSQPIAQVQRTLFTITSVSSSLPQVSSLTQCEGQARDASAVITRWHFAADRRDHGA
jgi:hypothetical protein